MKPATSLVIVGASYAGVQLAASAREQGFADRIMLIGEETHLPYQRPPLSKGLLTGKTAVDQLQLRGPSFYSDNAIELMLGHRVSSLDAAALTVDLTDGSRIDAGWIALATGARCRPVALPGVELAGVFDLRTLDDAQQIAAAATTARRACVIGGGFIGLEVASALRSRGVDVTIIEAQPRLLMRGLPPLMSTYIERAHRQRGNHVLTGSGVREIRGEHGRVTGVVLSDGAEIGCELVVFGVGVIPNDDIARRAGLAVDNGILADRLGRTSAPRVLAIGDVANIELAPHPGRQGRMRLESIQAANDGAKAAASGLVGRNEPSDTVPWFWSDQFDLKLQMAGLPLDNDAPVVRGDMNSDRFSVFYLRDGALVAAHSINKPAEHMLSRKLISRRARLTADQLSDESFDLKRTAV
ncbi:MAG: FAD-dependent oxidoreductase [Pseudomonadota bacterium]